MRLKVSPWWVLALLLAVCFTLATTLQLRAPERDNNDQSNNFFKLLLGDGRRLFANEFYVMADVYFHSGYYPSVFDKQEDQSDVLAAVHGQSDDEEDTTNVVFFGAPKDWVDSFGWRFRFRQHTHLENGKQREILPWLQLAAEMNPQMIDTYTVAAYWLRTSLNDPKQAEAFLREGLRNNPDSYEILFELGRLYYENRKDTEIARNLWELALRKWTAQEQSKKEPNFFLLEEITVNLARLEEQAGNYGRAIGYLELGKKASPHPEVLQRQIDEIKQKLAAKPQSSGPESR